MMILWQSRWWFLNDDRRDHNKSHCWQLVPHLFCANWCWSCLYTMLLSASINCVVFLRSSLKRPPDLFFTTLPAIWLGELLLFPIRLWESVQFAQYCYVFEIGFGIGFLAFVREALFKNCHCEALLDRRALLEAGVIYPVDFSCF